MPTENELIEIYRSYTEEKLFEYHKKRSDLTEEAQKALDKVISEYGGIGKLIAWYKRKVNVESEKNRISEETEKLYSQGKGSSDIIKSIKSEILTDQEILEIISDKKTETEDKRIKPRTIVGGILGGFIGGTLGGILWGYLLIRSEKIIFIFLFGLFVICYFFVWLFTRQSRKNTAVVVMTIIAVIYALIIGQVLYEL